MSKLTHYTALAKFFHWLTAGLIVSQYVLIELAENAEHAGKIVAQLGLLANHKSVGMTVVVLAIFRVLWRLFNKPPALPEGMPGWQYKASDIAHYLLYGLIFAIPISGWLMSSANAYSVSWFNLFVFPDLVGPNESLAGILHDVHEILAKALFVIALLHIVAALKHHFIDKDDVLRRMASKFGWLVLIASIVLIVGLFGRISSAPEQSNDTTLAAATNAQQVAQVTISDLPLWKIDYAQSYIQFSGDQAGAPFAA